MKKETINYAKVLSTLLELEEHLQDALEESSGQVNEQKALSKLRDDLHNIHKRVWKFRQLVHDESVGYHLDK
jgi:hypothetical protein